MKVSTLSYQSLLQFLFAYLLLACCDGSSEEGDADAVRSTGRVHTQAVSREELLEANLKINEMKEGKDSRNLQIIPSTTSAGSINVDVFMIIFEANQTLGDVPNPIVLSDDQVVEQMRVLNEGFAQTPFTFNLLDAFRATDDFFYNVLPSDPVSPLIDLTFIYQAPRLGDPTTLHIYVGNAQGGESFAYLPFPINLGGRPFDGVYLDINTFPGAVADAGFPYGEGKTLVKATGKWLGLLDTYGSNSGNCTAGDDGDFVDDTPQQASATSGDCPTGRDSCPSFEGLDPINNFMDDSSDACRTEFTQGQIDRMYYTYSIYRAGGETCPTGYHLFQLDYTADFFPTEINWSLESTDGEISFSTASGDVDAFQAPRGSHVFDFCVPTDKTYNFTVTDTPKENGLFADGNMDLSLDGNRFHRVNNNFGAAETTIFQAPLPPSLPPTPSPTFEPLPPSPGFAPCSICGIGVDVSNPDLIVNLPQQGDISCLELFRAGQGGFIDAVFCPFIRTSAEACCSTVAPTVPGTAAPTTAAPTDAVATPPPTNPPTVAATPPPTVAATPVPTPRPTMAPTVAATPPPTVAATPVPTPRPTMAPTVAATPPPTTRPTMAPTVAATPPPTPRPTMAPTIATPAPTVRPTFPPFLPPSPIFQPTTQQQQPTFPPFGQPTFQPTTPPFQNTFPPGSFSGSMMMMGGAGGLSMGGMGMMRDNRMVDLPFGTQSNPDDDLFVRRGRHLNIQRSVRGQQQQQ